MGFDIPAFLKLLFTDSAYLAGLDWGNIEFDSIQVVYVLSLVILLVLLLKFLFVMIGRHRSYRKSSGHFIFETRQVGPAERVTSLIMPAMVIIPLAAFLIVLAGANKKINNVEYIQTEFRQQMVLIDSSISVGWESDISSKSWAEIMRDGYGELLSLRAAKKDRVSVWIFANQPWMVSDFITDTRYLRDRIFKAPYVLIDPNSFYLPGSKSYFPWPYPKVILPEDKIMKISGEGGTNLALALREMIKYFDWKGEIGYSGTTFIVITDGSPNHPEDQDPELLNKDLEILRKKKIKLLVLYMHNSTNDRYAGNNGPFGKRALLEIDNEKKFREDVLKYGGQFYRASNLAELREMYRRIDEQEAVKYNQKVYKDKINYSENFLRFGTSVLFFVILAGLFSSVRRGKGP